MAHTAWKGYLSFGLISIPVKLFCAAREERMEMHQYHRGECLGRIKMPKTCAKCEQLLGDADIIKGVELSKDTVVFIEKQELDAFIPRSDKIIEVVEFVKLHEIDPVYFGESYYICPEKVGKRAYELLLRSMEDAQYIGLAKVTMSAREHLICIRPVNNILTMHKMYYREEVREIDFNWDRTLVEPKPNELDLARRLISGMCGTFEPSKYKDVYLENVRGLVEAKSLGKDVKIPQQQTTKVATMDIQTLLLQSVQQMEKTKNDTMELVDKLQSDLTKKKVKSAGRDTTAKTGSGRKK